jgi:hypothetical protein
LRRRAIRATLPPVHAGKRSEEMDAKPTAPQDDEPELTARGLFFMRIATPLGLLMIGIIVVIMGVCMHYLPGW